MVTRPGVKKKPSRLWVGNIQLGIDSGRQLMNSPLGSPACSAASSFAICAAAALFHGTGSVLMRRSWSVMFGVQTPLQSGRLARADQSFGSGGGLMTTGPEAALGGLTTIPTSAVAASM